MTQARLRNFVNGKHTDPCEGAYSDVVDPSTGEVYAAGPGVERGRRGRGAAGGRGRVRELARHHARPSARWRC